MGRVRRAGDRRGHPRFETRGPLSATLEIDSPVVLKKVEWGGREIEVEAELAPGVNSFRFAQLVLGEGDKTLDVIVRHIEPLSPAPDEHRYRISLELMGVSSEPE